MDSDIADLRIHVDRGAAPEIRALLRKRWAEGVRFQERAYWLLWRRFDVTGRTAGVQMVANDYARWREQEAEDRVW